MRVAMFPPRRGIGINKIFEKLNTMKDDATAPLSGALNNLKNMNELRKVAEFLNTHVITETSDGVICKFNGHGWLTVG